MKKKTFCIILAVLLIFVSIIPAEAKIIDWPDNVVIPYQIGDANLDGKITSADYLLIKKSFSEDPLALLALFVRVGWDNPLFEDFFSIVGDINQDGSIKSGDYLMLRLYFRGKTDLPKSVNESLYGNTIANLRKRNEVGNNTKTDCTNCNGTGKIVTGTTPCTNCTDGYNKRLETKVDSNGKPYSYWHYYSCSYCNATGKISTKENCPVCSGTGKI